MWLAEHAVSRRDRMITAWRLAHAHVATGFARSDLPSAIPIAMVDRKAGQLLKTSLNEVCGPPPAALAVKDRGGLGFYLTYVPFGAMPFKHIIALYDRLGDADFPIYPADAFGYTGSIGLLLHGVASPGALWLVFLRYAAFAIGIVLFRTMIVAVAWFTRRIRP